MKSSLMGLDSHLLRHFHHELRILSQQNKWQHVLKPEPIKPYEGREVLVFCVLSIFELKPAPPESDMRFQSLKPEMF